MTSEQKKFIDEIGRCELCGSRRNLQLHHMIPLVCENEFVNLDVEDNWLCVCGSCHSKLTPKNLLVKYGISKAKLGNKEFAKKLNNDVRHLEFAEWIEAEIDDHVTLRASEIHNEFVKRFVPEWYGFK